MRIRILILSALWLLTSAYTSAQTKWVGNGDGTSWNDAANWSTGLVPAPGEDVILDNTSVLTNYDVNLPAGAASVTINSITVTPTSGNTIRLILPATNTSATGLNIATTGNALVLNAGGHLINASAANINITGNVVLQPGSSIDASTGGNSPVLSIQGNILIVAPAAGAITESGTGNPVIELNGNAPQTITSANGAITGDNLDFIINTTDTVSLLSSVFLPHSLFVQAGTVDISNGATNFTLGVKGDLVVSGNITESGTSALSRVILNGTTNQNITVTGSITGDQLDFRLNNAAGATLLSDVTLPYRYTITLGNLTLGDFSLTTPVVLTSAVVATNHIITNGNGFLIIPNIGMPVSIFPVGIDATSVNQVEISNGSGLTYSVKVAPGVNPPITTPFAAINRTWTINTNSPAANVIPANVAFYYYTGQGGVNFDFLSTIDIGQFLPSAWNILENGIAPTSNPPEYRAVTSINSFNTPFIVGNHGAILPIDYTMACKAQRKGNDAFISWKVPTNEIVNTYEIERSVNGGKFITFTSVKPDNEKFTYTYTDKNLSDGTTVYQVKANINNETSRYSNTVSVLFNTKVFAINSLAPNPVQNDSKLTISIPAGASVRMSLYDVQGKMVKEWEERLSGGMNVVPLHTGNLLPGVYFLTASDGDNRTNVFRIVKQ